MLTLSEQLKIGFRPTF